MKQLDSRLRALEQTRQIDGGPMLTLATWRAEHDRPDFAERWPVVAARRAAALEAEQLGGHDGQEN